jgi:hypothetical protein
MADLPIPLISLEDGNDLLAELINDSHRHSAIIGGAAVDAALDSLLRSKLRKKCTETDDLLREEGGPLSSCGSKAKACYAMGLIYHYVYKDIYYINKIRNKFAHALTLEDNNKSKPVSFTTPPIDGWCRTLKTATGRRPDNGGWSNVPEGKDDPWFIYVMSVLNIVRQLTKLATLPIHEVHEKMLIDDHVVK